MADNEDKKSAKPPRPEKGEKGDKAKQAQPKADKAAAAKGGDKGGKPEAGEKKPKRAEERVTPRLRTHFDQVVRKQLVEQNGYKNPMEVPMIKKIVINMGVGEAVNDRKKVEFGRFRSDVDRWTEGGDHQGEKIHRHL